MTCADLVAWLREQIAEDRRTAYAARDALVHGGNTGTDGTCLAVRQHIYRFTPKRVLAECDFKERILDSWDNPDTSEMALTYADRPGYREEWKP